MKVSKIIPFLLITTLFGCGGGSSNDDQVESILTGVFLDSAVKGLSYKTDTQSGITDENGTLKYMAGEEVTLSIGGIELPPFVARPIMTPFDVFNTNGISDKEVVNLAILLQSLDSDQNPENGIDIPSDALNNTIDTVDFSQETSLFMLNDDIVSLVTSTVALATGLVSPIEATKHLAQTLGDEGQLNIFDPTEYTNLIEGNTTTFGEFYYYYGTDGYRYTNQVSPVGVTPWYKEDSGALCENSITFGLLCADTLNVLITNVEGSDTYIYTDNNGVYPFNIIQGDSLNLSDNITVFNPVEYTDLIIGNTTTYGEFSYYYSEDGNRYTNEVSPVASTPWYRDESGAICENSLRSGLFCTTDMDVTVATEEGSNIFTYRDKTTYSRNDDMIIII